jgi:hypothetical protein
MDGCVEALPTHQMGGSADVLQADFFILVDIRTFITFLETVIART